MRLFLAVFSLLAAFPAVHGQHSEWRPVKVPEPDGWNGAKGFGWYRAYVHIPEAWRGSRLLLMTESISDVDEAFVNGEKVGANGSMPPLFGNPSSSIRRPFVVEPDQIRFGEHNLIAWRVFNNGGKGGMIDGPIHLSRKNDAIDLSGHWLFRRGDVPAWAKWHDEAKRKDEVAAYLDLIGAEPAGHRGVIPADVEWRKRMVAAVEQHFEGNPNPYARADDKGDPSSPEAALRMFETGTGLAVDTVLSEPLVRQPLFVDFDERGRMWVVQYIQYPNPAGLEVLTWDKHLRKVFDQVPPSPPYSKPEHAKFIGKDKITIHEDTDGDGRYDKHSTFLDGLNMVTSVTQGDGGVWVLHPPYLLFFPDEDGDDVPDREPVVHLSGFNLEDTHSISNSLKFGPDGWLYGCTGSTVTARVRVHLNDKEPRHAFLGQNIWRYHPARHVFELFAEGGWNNFGVDFDEKGRLYSGTNGTQQAVHFVQGGYYQKGFGKHGPHTNPYAFGHFYGMPIEGERVRLVHQWIRYQSGALPGLEDHWIGGNSLGNKVHALRAEQFGSTFKTVEVEKPLHTKDQWFRPVHCAIGPDGAVYISDFYDARITHVDPRDNWDRSNGRIHRLRSAHAHPATSRNLGDLSSTELVAVLGEHNQWARSTARRLLAGRNDSSVVPALRKMLASEDAPQTSLEALWVLHLLGRLPEVAAIGLAHADPHVRLWTVRLLGDNRESLFGDALATVLAMARSDQHAEVVSQLSATTQRVVPAEAAALLRELVARREFSDDPFIPQQIWWAMESLVTRSSEHARYLLAYSGFWEAPLFQQVIRERIGRRYLAERSPESLAMCAFLLERAAGTKHLDPLIRGMAKALEGSSLDPVPPALDAALAKIWREQDEVSEDVIRFSLRLKSPRALAAARPLVADRDTATSRRLELLKALAELRDQESERLFLGLFADRKEDPAVRLAALSALRRYSGSEIPSTVLQHYSELEGDLRQTAQSLLASRPEWALRLLRSVNDGTIQPDALGVDTVLLMKSHDRAEIRDLIAKHWGELKQSDLAKSKRITEIKALLTAGGTAGDPDQGSKIFAAACAICHKFGEDGREIGPDLTGYEMKNLDYLVPAIVDPNLGIREGFELATLTLRAPEGQPPAILTGFITDANQSTLTIRDLAGNSTVVARRDLAGESRAAVSVMPEGLLDALDDQQIRDLVAYLQSSPDGK